MAVQSTEEFLEALQRLSFAGARPGERWFINRDRRKRGLPPLR
jgi:hypothetical protein